MLNPDEVSSVSERAALVVNGGDELEGPNCWVPQQFSADTGPDVTPTVTSADDELVVMNSNELEQAVPATKCDGGCELADSSVPKRKVLVLRDEGRVESGLGGPKQKVPVLRDERRVESVSRWAVPVQRVDNAVVQDDSWVDIESDGDSDESKGTAQMVFKALPSLSRVKRPYKPRPVTTDNKKKGNLIIRLLQI